MSKRRLDVELARRRLVISRSQAESYIKLGKVKVNGKILTRQNLKNFRRANQSGYLVGPEDVLEIIQGEQYVGRAALKLASVADKLELDFKNKYVLDVGSSTGGFTDYALKRGATRVVAVDVGTDQLHSALRANPRVELHEKTDIRDFSPSQKPDIVLIDVSFISLRQVLPAIAEISGKNTQIVAMLKPQFETGAKEAHKGVIKNDSIRRQILKDFEVWAKNHFIIKAKADSQVPGSKGNLERFYLLHKSA